MTTSTTRFRFSSRLLLGAGLVAALGGCLSKAEVDARDVFDTWRAEATAIEQGAKSGQVDQERTRQLCGLLRAGMTPERWQGLNDSVGRKTSTINSWVAVDAWQKMRCGSDTP